ncbi:hypothetical protein [Streptomyces kaniharaensis]|uniref:hypothetical protein n=1 Tax=Streptomyces kaniharaensis TaxID=212423 RepID=UPI001295E6A4|nr:hypothetical protein [Streptomyces kaniharaensis]
MGLFVLADTSEQAAWQQIRDLQALTDRHPLVARTLTTVKAGVARLADLEQHRTNAAVWQPLDPAHVLDPEQAAPRLGDPGLRAVGRGGPRGGGPNGLAEAAQRAQVDLAVGGQRRPAAPVRAWELRTRGNSSGSRAASALRVVAWAALGSLVDRQACGEMVGHRVQQTGQVGAAVLEGGDGDVQRGREGAEAERGGPVLIHEELVRLGSRQTKKAFMPGTSDR